MKKVIRWWNVLKFKKNEKGQAMVEYAIVLPIFLLVMMFLMEIGWITYQKVIFDYTCRNTAWEIGNIQVKGYEGFTWPRWFSNAEEHVMNYKTVTVIPTSNSNGVIKEYFSIANDNTTGHIDTDNITVSNGKVSIYPGDKHYRNKKPMGEDPEIQQEVQDNIFRTTNIEIEGKIEYVVQTITPVNQLCEKIFGQPIKLTNNLYKVKRNRMKLKNQA